MNIKHLAATMAILAALLIAPLFYATMYTSKDQTSPGIVQHFQLKDLNFDPISDKKELLTWLEDAEKSIWIEVKETFNLTKQECDTLKQTDQLDYKESTLSMQQKYSSGQDLSPNTVNFIQGIMKEFGIQAELVTILPWNSSVVASATDTLLFINETQLNSNKLNTKKYIIGHELMHILNKDHSTRYFVRNSPTTKPVKENDCNNPINKLCQFHEFRADMLCSLQGPEYAEGAQDYLLKEIKKNGDLQFPHYPKFSLRNELVTKIAHIHTLQPRA